MEKAKYWFRTWAYGNADGQYFKNENRDAICRINMDILYNLTLIITCLMGLYFILCSFSAPIPGYLVINMFFCIGNLICLGLAAQYKKKPFSAKIVNALCLLYFFMAMVMGISIGVVIEKNTLATVFSMVITMGQLMFVLPPLYSTGMALVGYGMMSVGTLINKPYSLAVWDMSNSFCALVVGAFFCWYFIQLRVNEDIAKHQVLLLNEKLAAMNNTDELTGAHNRRYFFKWYEKEFEKCRDTGDTMSVIILDIDLFKTFNDHFGHVEGDKCIKVLVETLDRTAQTYGLFVARYGGEEFVAAARGLSAEQAEEIGCALVQSVEALGIMHAYTANREIVTVSCGVNCAPVTLQDNSNTFLIRADNAMYFAKREGGNCVRTAQ